MSRKSCRRDRGGRVGKKAVRRVRAKDEGVACAGPLIRGHSDGLWAGGAGGRRNKLPLTVSTLLAAGGARSRTLSTTVRMCPAVLPLTPPTRPKQISASTNHGTQSQRLHIVYMHGVAPPPS
ncbi:hypothetical protein E2C01_015977 [Portunus trituberculatus]|uniref:Uncharacterized protein n=1 Tax=Portunus trituberculatus TaxID=210409 RepID=A0A5B7DP05_PORTR|nr:hypothetical protein [Portunus trituberculatus]